VVLHLIYRQALVVVLLAVWVAVAAGERGRCQLWQAMQHRRGILGGAKVR